MIYQLIETNCGMGNMGEATTKVVAMFTTLDKLFHWLEKRGYTVLKSGQFERTYRDGESRLGECWYKISIMPLDPLDPT